MNIFLMLFQMFNDLFLNAEYVQYHHIGSCQKPCHDCPERDKRIYKREERVKVPAHPHCDCFYTNVKTKAAGSISNKGFESPDVWLKLYGKLPDYYITKDEAINLGWDNSKNTIAGKAPGKMLGGDVFRNERHILPEKEGRIWYECDIDYTTGKRGPKRLYYSNDGLMFYSPDHLNGDVTAYQIK